MLLFLLALFSRKITGQQRGRPTARTVLAPVGGRDGEREGSVCPEKPKVTFKMNGSDGRLAD